ncbi:MAG: signal peptide peptidase SppA [Minisyncoccia bacterium]
MRQKITKILKISFIVICVILTISIWTGGSHYFITSFLNESSDLASNDSAELEDCNVYGINIHGNIVSYHANDAYNDQDKLTLDETSSDEVIGAVNKAQSAENVKALIIEIDSGGGYPVAGEEIMRALKDSNKPVIAFIRSVGASAAYLAATGAQTIFASKFSDVGSIGITGSYLQETEKNKKEGLTYIDLSSGIYKDSGSPNRPLTEADKQIFMRDIKIGYEHFVNLVSQNRNLSIEMVKKLADGSTIMGDAALKNGLIDKIGLYPDAKKFISEKIGAPVIVCWQN